MFILNMELGRNDLVAGVHLWLFLNLIRWLLRLIRNVHIIG